MTSGYILGSGYPVFYDAEHVTTTHHSAADDTMATSILPVLFGTSLLLVSVVLVKGGSQWTSDMGRLK